MKKIQANKTSIILSIFIVGCLFSDYLISYTGYLSNPDLVSFEQNKELADFFINGSFPVVSFFLLLLLSICIVIAIFYFYLRFSSCLENEARQDGELLNFISHMKKYFAAMIISVGLIRIFFGLTWYRFDFAITLPLNLGPLGYGILSMDPIEIALIISGISLLIAILFFLCYTLLLCLNWKEDIIIQKKEAINYE